MGYSTRRTKYLNVGGRHESRAVSAHCAVTSAAGGLGWSAMGSVCEDI